MNGGGNAGSKPDGDGKCVQKRNGLLVPFGLWKYANKCSKIRMVPKIPKAPKIQKTQKIPKNLWNRWNLLVLLNLGTFGNGRWGRCRIQTRWGWRMRSKGEWVVGPIWIRKSAYRCLKIAKGPKIPKVREIPKVPKIPQKLWNLLNLCNLWDLWTFGHEWWGRCRIQTRWGWKMRLTGEWVVGPIWITKTCIQIFKDPTDPKDSKESVKPLNFGIFEISEMNAGGNAGSKSDGNGKCVQNGNGLLIPFGPWKHACKCFKILKIPKIPKVPEIPKIQKIPENLWNFWDLWGIWDLWAFGKEWWGRCRIQTRWGWKMRSKGEWAVGPIWIMKTCTQMFKDPKDPKDPKDSKQPLKS